MPMAKVPAVELVHAFVATGIVPLLGDIVSSVVLVVKVIGPLVVLDTVTTAELAV